MEVNEKTLEKLRILINEDTEYRSGPKLVSFFQKYGFNDSYGQGFPSRWFYTDSKLEKLNGTSDLDKLIKDLFNPVNFIGRTQELDKHISELNEFLVFDKWQVVRNNVEITFKRADEITLPNTEDEVSDSEDAFLEKDFGAVNIDILNLDSQLTTILKQRIEEVKKTLKSNAPLATLFLCGSTLEGILLGLASKNPQHFNTAKSSPKDSQGKVKKMQNWTLSNLIDVSRELEYIGEDVKKFSHALRDFRNYIHPHQQMASQFSPDKHTAQISWQVLKASIAQISENKTKKI